MNDGDASQPEEDQIPDPHPAVEVHGFLAVIPPAGVETLLHDVAGEILHQTADQKGQSEGGAVSGLEPGQIPHHQSDESCAAAVDGQDGAREEAPVDEAVELPILEDHLDAPAQQGIGKEQQDEIDDIFQGSFLHSSR